MLYDITPPLSAATNVWPGDTPFRRDVLCEIERGATVTLSAIHSTVHLGAHADGPNHYGPHAPGIGERSLDYYLGPCTVVHARHGFAAPRVGAKDLETDLSAISTPRVLIRTGTFPDFANWNAAFAGLEPDLIDALHRRGVITIGTDTPSVDPQDSKDLPAHKAFLRHDMAILEGLDLRDVPQGDYELIALPLRLLGFDASPIRAVLRPLPRR